MKAKIAFIGILVLLVISCQPEKEVESLDIGDIAAQSTRVLDTSAVEKPQEELTILEDTSQWRKSGIQWRNLEHLDTLLLPDRFGPVTTQKFLLDMDGREVYFFQWSFSKGKGDSAFKNWAQCFGKKCHQLIPGNPEPIDKSGFLVFSNATTLYYIGPIAKKDYLQWSAIYLNEKATYNYWVYQLPRDTLSWSKIEDGQLVPWLTK